LSSTPPWRGHRRLRTGRRDAAINKDSRGSFTSVKDLVSAIGAFIDHWTDQPVPFAWTKDADTILDSIKRAKTK
jgi:hypothetical protein